MAAAEVEVSMSDAALLGSLLVSGGMVTDTVTQESAPLDEVSDDLTHLAPAPTHDRDGMVAAWAARGTLTPKDTGRPWVDAWVHVLEGTADDADVQAAAYALQDVDVRDVIIGTAATFPWPMPTDVGADVEPLRKFADRLNVDALRRAVVRLADGPDAVPFLTVAACLTYAAGRIETAMLRARLDALNAREHYRLAALILAIYDRAIGPKDLFRAR
ncbi:hypothetical protein VV01_00350 [Luteipulveratus halotolerans]|nr:hypothetical protein VV01_00350 [Luteipulveratus halotolerans]